MKKTANIAEMFTSIQGEGPYVGAKQLFIRFCGCNLKCEYCDTEHEKGDAYTSESLIKKINEFDLDTIHSISLTGGEPLCWADFLEEFLPMLSEKIYLETNATLDDKLEQIADYVDIISADIKLPSTSRVKDSFKLHDKFFKVAKDNGKEIFAKIVFDENITDEEIESCVELAKKHELELILQPKTVNEKVSVNNEVITEILDKFLKKYSKTRLIPQVHKFLDVI